MRNLLAKLKSPLGIAVVVLLVFSVIFAGGIFFVVQQVKESNSEVEVEGELIRGILGEYIPILFDEIRAKHLARGATKLSDALEPGTRRDFEKSEGLWEEAAAEIAAAAGDKSLMLGIVLAGKGQMEEDFDRWVLVEKTEKQALDCFSSLKSQQHVVLNCRQQLAQALQHQSKYLAALPLFEENVSLAERIDTARGDQERELFVNACFSLADFYAAEHRPDLEQATYDRLLVSVGQAPAAGRLKSMVLFRIAEHLEKGDVERCMKAWEAAFAADPDDGVRHREYGKYLRLREKFDQALKEFDIAIKSGKQLPLAYSGRAKTYNLLGRYPEALADVNAALKLEPDFYDGLVTRGATLVAQKKYAEAIADFTKALEQYNTPVVLLARGEAYACTGQNPLAVGDFSEAVRIVGQRRFTRDEAQSVAHPEFFKKPIKVILLQKRAAVYDALKDVESAKQDRAEAAKLESVPVAVRFFQSGKLSLWSCNDAGGRVG
ncbi:MAG: tetratricopeptide repeat protein [Cyanobacteria bacterium SZAS LIN-3]|nr:tetratricopeptide repeat protein [Cyanobacteria bacterium SZAS LIN-3]